MPKQKWKPLMLAASQGHKAVVDRLVAAGAQPTMVAARSACGAGRESILKVLLNAGVPLNGLYKGEGLPEEGLGPGETLLLYAAKLGAANCGGDPGPTRRRRRGRRRGWE